MEEQENVAPVDELTSEEVVQPTQDSTSSLKESSSEPAPGSKEYNWARVREEQRRNEEKISALEAQLKRSEAPAEPVLDDDDLIEGRHYKQILKKMEELVHVQDEKTLPMRLRSRFSDFDSVVTRENVERLEKEEPELAASISSSGDRYSTGVAAYKLISKMYGGRDHYQAEKEAVEKNLSRPGSSASAVGQSPLDHADAFSKGLTPELKRALLKEMEESARRL